MTTHTQLAAAVLVATLILHLAGSSHAQDSSSTTSTPPLNSNSPQPPAQPTTSMPKPARPLFGRPPTGVWQPDGKQPLGGAGRRLPGDVISRPTLPKSDLSLLLSVALADESTFHTALLGDRAQRAFSAHPASEDDSFVVEDGVDFVTMHFVTTDAELGEQVAVTHPTVISMEPDVVETELDAYLGVFKTVPHVSLPPVPGAEDASRASTASFSMKMACLKPGKSRLILHFTVVPQTAVMGQAVKPKRLTSVTAPAGRSLLWNPDGANFHKTLSISFVKECAGESEVDGMKIDGFMVGLSQDPSQAEVVLDGIPRDDFSREDRLQIIDPSEVSTTLYVAYTNAAKGAKLVVKKPVVVAEYADVVQPALSGSLMSDRTIFRASTKPKSVSITYNCRRPSQSVVDIEFPTSQGTVTVKLMKNCTGAMRFRTEGFGVRGLMVGSGSVAQPSSDVIVHGLTQPRFRTAVDENDDDRAGRFEVSDSSDTVEFVMYLDKSATVSKQEFSRPVVIVEVPNDDGDDNDDGFVEETPPPCFPVIRGSVLQATELKPDGDKLTITVDHQCVRKGRADITVKVPLKPTGELTFSYRKACAVRPRSEAEVVDFGLRHIAGFNIGRGDSKDNVVKDGIVHDDYHWSTAVSDLHIVDGDTASVDLVVSFADLREQVQMNAAQGGSGGGSVPVPTASTVQIDKPLVFSHYKVLQPALGGSVAGGVKLNHHESHTLTVTFNCIKPGKTMVSLVLPVSVTTASKNPGNGEVQSWYQNEQIVIQVGKVCDEDESSDETIATAGGVSLPGFYVGTTPGGDNVVRNGFPDASYFGQRLKMSPDWEDALVGVANSSVTLYMSYKGDSGDSQLQFQAPTLITHDNVFGAKLSGAAAHGGEILRGSGQMLDLDVNFRCRYAGMSAVTLTIPIVPTGLITLTIPKACDGRKRAESARMPGVMIGTKPKSSDVVKDGVVKPKYAKIKPGDDTAKRDIVSGSVDLSTFYVRHEKLKLFKPATGPVDRAPVTPLLQVGEPVVFAHRPICDPTVQHNLAHTAIEVEGAAEEDSKGESKPKYIDGQRLVVSDIPSALNVSYDCVWPGTTAVTLIIPVFPVGQVAFTWVKRCDFTDGDADDDGDGGGDGDNDQEDHDGWVEPEWTGDDGDDWERWDEVRWDTQDDYDHDLLHDEEDPEDVAQAAAATSDEDGSDGGEVAVPTSRLPCGFLDVGTASFFGKLENVVSEGRPRPLYTINSPQVRIFDPDQNFMMFFVSVPRGFQDFDVPQIRIMHRSESTGEEEDGQAVCKPTLGGPVSAGGRVQAGTPQLLHINFNCQSAGMSRILVTIPLIPRHYGSASFSMVKVCGGFVAHEESYWTAGHTLTLLAVVVVCAVLFRVYAKLKDRSGKLVLPS